MNEISFSYEKIDVGTKTHFEKETKGNPQMTKWPCRLRLPYVAMQD